MLNKARREILLAEYGELVENLRHWDKVFWQAASVFLIVLAALLSSAILQPRIRFAGFLLFVFISVVLCQMYFRIFRTSKERIRRIVEIEKELGMEQYQILERYKKSRSIHKYFSGSTWIVFIVGILVFWIYLLLAG